MAKKVEGKERKFKVDLYNEVSRSSFSQVFEVVKESEIHKIVKDKYSFTVIKNIELI